MTRGPKTWTAAKPGRAKAKTSKTQAIKVDQVAEDEISIPKELQQKCLDIFKRALWTGPEDIAALQEVKGHLYNRDFLKAFGSEHYLRAYALRWSAARALGYLQVFGGIEEHLLDCGDDLLKVLAVGGGAGAELVALAGRLNRSGSDNAAGDQQTSIKLDLVDIAAWQQVAESLANACNTPVELSKYASAAAREANVPFVPAGRLHTQSEQANVLDWDGQMVVSKTGPMDLVTIMFTLNELYSTSVPKTQRFLSYLTAAMHHGALLLIVDSPGSYSTVAINGAEKKYPMQWLLDHTLLGPKADEARPMKWEKLVEHESKWFRLPDGLRYPIELENMRYQMHLYRRTSLAAG